MSTKPVMQINLCLCSYTKDCKNECKIGYLNEYCAIYHNNFKIHGKIYYVNECCQSYHMDLKNAQYDLSC